MTTIEFQAIEFDTIGEALQWVDADRRGTAILLEGRYFVVTDAEAERLNAAGVEFAYVHDHDMPDGEQRIITVPVN